MARWIRKLLADLRHDKRWICRNCSHTPLVASYIRKKFWRGENRCVSWIILNKRSLKYYFQLKTKTTLSRVFSHKIFFNRYTSKLIHARIARMKLLRTNDRILYQLIHQHHELRLDRARIKFLPRNNPCKPQGKFPSLQRIATAIMQDYWDEEEKRSRR